MSSSLSLPPKLNAIHQTLLEFAPHATLVGGAVRDLILHRPVRDLDYVVEGNGLRIGRKLADKLGAAYYPLDESRKIARVVWKQEDDVIVVDISSLIGITLEEDIRRRDFTINAIAMRGQGQIFDPLAGVKDLKQGILRPCSPDSLYNDPVRTIRAVRFLHLFHLKPAPGLDSLVWHAAPGLTRISPERQRDEFIKLLAIDQPHLAIEQMQDWRITDVLLPELAALIDVKQPKPHIFDVYRHTLQTLYWLSRLDAWILHEAPAENKIEIKIQQRLQEIRPALQRYLQEPLTSANQRWLWLRFAALAHDWGKPRAFRLGENNQIHFYGHEQLSATMAADWMERHHCARSEINFVRQVCAAHMRPLSMIQEGKPSARALFRFYRDVGDAAPATIILFLADFLGMRGEKTPSSELDLALENVVSFLTPFVENEDASPIPPPLLKGKTIIEMFNLQPGPQIGQLLSSLQEAQAAGEVQTLEQAIEYVKTLLQENQSP